MRRNPLTLKRATRSENRSNRQNTLARSVYHRRLRCEELEERRMLSVFVVNNLNDGPVANPGDLAGSLRQAIFDANHSTGQDVIQFGSGLSGTITLTAGELAITDSVSVTGPGAASVTIDAAGSSRIFKVDDVNDGTNIDVVIEGLTLTGGNASAIQPPAAGCGGAIYSKENLTLRDSIVVGNTANRSGGGIYAESYGTTTIQNNTISGNTSRETGGGIFTDSYGTVTIQNNTISGNTTSSYSSGGGICAYSEGTATGSPGTTTIQNNTISGNTATGNGGGIFTQIWGGGTTTIQNNSICGNNVSGNPSANYGGGIAAMNYGTTNIQDNTISGNTASGYGGGIWIENSRSLVRTNGMATIQGNNISENTAGGDGGGIWAKTSNGATIIESSTIFGNTAGNGGGIIARNIYDGTMMIQNSTVSGNTASNNGGGVWTLTADPASAGAGGSTTIQNSTVSGNTASNNGGGIWTSTVDPQKAGGPTTIQNSTITGNTADSDANDSGNGGGIFSETGTVAIESTIIAGNEQLSNTVTYNARQDFSETSNPNGAWSYGYRPHSSDPMILFNRYGLQPPEWYADNYIFSGAPHVMLIPPEYWNGGGFHIGPNDLSFHPAPGAWATGGDLDWAIIRWTAPTDGIIDLSAQFGGVYGVGTGTRDLFVLRDSDTLFETTIYYSAEQYQTASYNNPALLVHAGDTIDFAVGPHDTWGGDWTSIAAIIDFTSITAPDIAGSVSIAHSLVGDNLGSGLTEAPVGSPDTNGNLIGGLTNGVIDPKLGLLANNGGATRTHALLASSPAIDMGSNPVGLTTDQRGHARILNGTVDIGAYEYDRGEMTLQGTPDADTFVFQQVGNELRVTVNGMPQTFDATVVQTLNLNGLGGSDQVWLYDTAGTDHFQVGPTHSILTLSTGVTVVTSGFEVTKGYATGGTNVPGQQDTAVLYGTNSNDKYYGYDTTGYILASQVGLSYYTYSFGSVEARVNVADAATGGAAGGTDIANLYDAVGSDTLYGRSPWRGGWSILPAR